MGWGTVKLVLQVPEEARSGLGTKHRQGLPLSWWTSAEGVLTVATGTQEGACPFPRPMVSSHGPDRQNLAKNNRQNKHEFAKPQPRGYGDLESCTGAGSDFSPLQLAHDTGCGYKGACPPGLWMLSNRYCLWLIKQKRSLEVLTVELSVCWQERRELEDEAQGSHFKHKAPGQVPALMS